MAVNYFHKSSKHASSSEISSLWVSGFEVNLPTIKHERKRVVRGKDRLDEYCDAAVREMEMRDLHSGEVRISNGLSEQEMGVKETPYTNEAEAMENAFGEEENPLFFSNFYHNKAIIC